MFERFTDEARVALVIAQEKARHWRLGYVGTEHLLLGLSEADGVAAKALKQIGFEPARFQQGVLDHVGHLVSPTPLPGHIPFTPRAKRAFEASLRQSLKMDHNHIGTDHIVVGLLQDDSSLATKLLAEQGISGTTVEAVVTRLLSRPDSSSEQVAVPADTESEAAADDVLEEMRPDAEVARCPGCDQPLADNLGAEVIRSVGEVERSFTVAYCRACGHVLTVLLED